MKKNYKMKWGLVCFVSLWHIRMNSFCQAFNFKSFAPIIIAVHNWYVYILSYGLKLIIYNIETQYCFLNGTQYQTVWQN